MTETIIAILVVAAAMLFAYDLLKPRPKSRHRWHELASSDVAHTHRIARRGR